MPTALLPSLQGQTECPALEKLQSEFQHSVEENATERISFKQWISTGRSTLGPSVS
jgi:hypothetical protein